MLKESKKQNPGEKGIKTLSVSKHAGVYIYVTAIRIPFHGKENRLSPGLYTEAACKNGIFQINAGPGQEIVSRTEMPNSEGFMKAAYCEAAAGQNGFPCDQGRGKNRKFPIPNSLSALQVTISAMQTAIKAVQSKMKTVQANISDVQTAIIAVHTAIKAGQRKMKAVQTTLIAGQRKMKAVQTTIITVQRKIKVMQTTIIAVQTAIIAVQTAKIAVQTAIIAVQTTINAVNEEFSPKCREICFWQNILPMKNRNYQRIKRCLQHITYADGLLSDKDARELIMPLPIVNPYPAPVPAGKTLNHQMRREMKH